MLWPKKADRASLHAGWAAWALGLVRGRGRPLSGRAASRGVVAAARATSDAAARIHPGRHDQDPDPVPSRIRPGAAPTGSVRARASKYNLCSRTCGDVPSRGFQDGQHRHGAAEELEPASVGGNVLVMAGVRAEEVAQFIVSPAEPGGRSGAFEVPHGSIAAFDAAVI